MACDCRASHRDYSRMVEAGDTPEALALPTVARRRRSPSRPSLVGKHACDFCFVLFLLWVDIGESLNILLLFREETITLKTPLVNGA